MTEEPKRVLVTGGAGFIGSHLVDRLVGSGFCVRVLDNLSTGRTANIQGHLENGKVDFVRGDIRDAKLVNECVEDVDFVAHLAAVASVPFSIEQPDLTFETNVGGTINLLVSSAKAKVAKFVLGSTCAVYGEPRYLPINERHPTNPISPYAESKLVAERFTLGFCQKQLLECIVLRLFNVYGPRQCINDYSGVITQFIECAKRGSPLTIYGDGYQTRDFISVRDVVDAILKCRENKVAVGEVLNVGSGEPTSINDLAKTVLELTRSESTVHFDEPRKGDIKDSYADVSKAEALLGFTSQLSLRDGLRIMLEESSVAR